MRDIHLTVAVVVPRGDQFLMVRERDKESGRLVYNQPAGHVELGESPVEAAIREALEETGWLVEIQGLIGIYNLMTAKGTHYCRMCFFALPSRQLDSAIIDSDIEETHWLDYAALKSMESEMRSTLVLKSIEDFQKGTIAPLSLFK